MSVTAIIPVRAGEPALGAAETICEALDVTGAPGDVQVVLIGAGTAKASDSLAASGFGDVAMWRAEVGDYAPGRWAVALAEHLGQPDKLVILPASVDGRDLAPRLAAQLGRRFVSGAVEVGPEVALVPRASGRALAEVTIDGPVVATLQVGVRAADRVATDDAVGAVDVPGFVLEDADGDAEMLEVTAASVSTMDLAEASFILGAGVGLVTVESVTELTEVAACLGASVGATRVVTDEGWLGHDRQIGTTGVVVDPTVYVAFGISGAVQHTSGLGAPDHVISVNTDEHCPMMHLADLAIVSDGPAVVHELRRRLTIDDYGNPSDGAQP